MKAILDGSHLVIDGERFDLGGSLYLRGTGITSLPDNLTVGGYLDLEGTGITSLPDNLTVGGYLDLRGTGITSLPDNLTVGGYLDLEGTGITSLPDNLTVGGYLDLEGTGITSLPDNLTVGGSLDLEGTGITSLPDNLTVGGSLYLRGTGITSLPDNLTVGGSLYLRGTGITPLPDNLTVGGYLDLEGTGSTDTSSVNRNAPSMLTWQNGRYILADDIFSEVVNKRGGVWRLKNIGKSEIVYLVTDGEGRYAHGKTIKGAREDLIYKIADRDKSAYEGLGLNHEFTFQEAIEAYRVITGACAAGVKQFVSSQERKDKYSVQEIIGITKGQYGHASFAEFFSAA
jgi:hypothetical protein